MNIPRKGLAKPESPQMRPEQEKLTKTSERESGLPKPEISRPQTSAKPPEVPPPSINEILAKNQSENIPTYSTTPDSGQFYLSGELKPEVEPTQEPTEAKKDTRIKPPSKWQSVKNKLSKTLRSLGLIGALAGGAKYAHDHTEMAKVAASETKDIWNKLSPEDKFALPSTGNLPSEALPEDIEPRLNQIKNYRKLLQKESTDPNSIDKSKKIGEWINALQEGVDKKEGWADPVKQTEFNLLLKDKRVRKILESQDLTMADAFSLIKSTISNSKPGVEPKDILNELINDRQKIAETNFIDHNTEQVIIFSSATPQDKEKFKGKELAEIALDAMGEKAIQDPNKYLKQIEAGIITNITRESPGEKLVKAIEESPDNTLIYISNHVEKNGIMAGMSPDGKPQMLNTDGFASAFLNRIVQKYQNGDRNARSASGKIKVIIDGCYGYNLANNIVSRMKEIYNTDYKNVIGVDFEDLKLPTIVTMSGDSSPVVLDKRSGSRALTSDSYRKMIKSQGALTGSMLLGLQSESYVTGGDMGFFISDHGKLKEVSSNQKTQKSRDDKYETRSV